MTNIKEINYENYGPCISMSNQTIEMIVTVEKGPRIVYLGFIGEENILFQDKEQKHFFLNNEISQICGQTAYHYLYGGHRFYLSPSHLPEARYPDNEAVVYSMDDDGVLFQAPTQKTSGLQLSYKIMLGETGSDFMIVHTAANHSADTQRVALCTSTMVKPGGFAVLPQNQGNEFFVADRVYVYWPFTRLHDPRFDMHSDFMTVQQDASMDYPFKIGYNNMQGWISYVNGNTVLSKRYVNDAKAVYPDNDASSQVYCSKDFLELTVQSPLYRIEPEDTVKHVENFSLFHTTITEKPNNNEAYQTFLETLV